MTGRQRVTVVDDDPTSLELLTEVLELMGHDVSPFLRVSPDLVELVESRPDLLVVDLRLATLERELSGWDIVRLAKRHRDLFSLPVLVISADLPQLRSLVPGALEYQNVLLLGKPFSLDSLTVMVGMALESNRVSGMRPGDAGQQPRPEMQ